MRNLLSLRILIADGDLDGPRVVERFNGIGKALIFPCALPPRCGDSLRCASARGRPDTALPVSDRGLDAGRRFGTLAFGKRRTDAFDRRRRLRRDAQCGLASCCRLEVRVGLLQRHAVNGRPTPAGGAS